MAAIKNASSPNHSSLRANRKSTNSSNNGPTASTGSGGGQKSDRSVTVLSTESLPSYCSERYYLLSELHIKVARLLSLDEIKPDAGEAEQVGESQEEDVLHEAWAEADSSGESFADTPTAADAVAANTSKTISTSVPPFLIVYLIWRRNVSLQDFVESVLAQALSICHDNLTIVSSLEDFSTLRGPPLSPPHHYHRHPFQQRLLGEHDDDDDESIKKRTSLYVVVDRISPSTPEQQLEEDAEALAKQVAARFRNKCEGITVGISNYASPGLAACITALEVGAIDRRKLQQGGETSTIGIITDCREDLEESKQNFDAAVNVIQSRVCAEWNGNGNLESFAARAHSQWRVRQGLSSFFPPVPKRRIPRLVAPPPTTTSSTTPSDYDYDYDTIMMATTNSTRLTAEERKQIAIEEAVQNRIFRDMLYDMSVYFVLFMFLVFHYRNDIMWMMDVRRMDDLIQYLRSM